MGEIILTQVGSALGASLFPNGFSVLGNTLSGAALGGALGALAGRSLDASMMSPT